MPGELWVWVEQDAGEVEPSSLEVLSKAREVADSKGLR